MKTRKDRASQAAAQLTTISEATAKRFATVMEAETLRLAKQFDITPSEIIEAIDEHEAIAHATINFGNPKKERLQ